MTYCAIVMVNARLFQSRGWKDLDASREARSATPAATVTTVTTSLTSAPKEGTVLGELNIPRLNLSVMVIEGVEDADLKRAAGHIPGTALPGQTGNLGIAAHRTTFFRPLRRIRLGDTITLKTDAAEYQYRVAATKIVQPEDVQVLYPDGKDKLTLVTCFPFDYVGHAPHRFIVWAERLPESRR